MSIPVISIAQMREWEKASWAAGKSEADVIRQGGKILAREARRLPSCGDTQLTLTGKGNNGAAARSAREHLTDSQTDLLDVKYGYRGLSTPTSLLQTCPALG